MGSADAGGGRREGASKYGVSSSYNGSAMVVVVRREVGNGRYGVVKSINCMGDPVGTSSRWCCRESLKAELLAMRGTSLPRRLLPSACYNKIDIPLLLLICHFIVIYPLRRKNKDHPLLCPTKRTGSCRD